jgi:lysophospholipase L1-like esterase
MEELCEWRGVWFSTDSHTLMASPSPEQTLLQLNSALATAHKALVSADYVILTLGTNRVYEREGRVVANCHRLPAEQFECRSLGVGEIVEELVSVCQNELAGKQIILTVSPIRHLKDGLAENSLSKATLRVAAAEVAERLPQVCYFPAYEALVDDLRDYRFYAADMVHPSEQAVEYVWRLFSESFLSPEDGVLNQNITRLMRSCQHRPLNPLSPEYREFLEHTIKDCQAFADAHPDVDLSAELNELTERLQLL